MGNPTIRRRYSDWLESFINRPDDEYDYSGLFALAFEIDFEVMKFVSRDVNRAMDGLTLRDLFEKETGLSLPYLGQCNMLEFLIALSGRMNEIVWEVGEADRTRKFFWILLSNLELDMWPNIRLEKEGDSIVRYIFKGFINRLYATDGTRGGLFPLKKAVTDQREVEIWYQMMNWFLEFPEKE